MTSQTKLTPCTDAKFVMFGSFNCGQQLLYSFAAHSFAACCCGALCTGTDYTLVLVVPA